MNPETTDREGVAREAGMFGRLAEDNEVRSLPDFVKEKPLEGLHEG